MKFTFIQKSTQPKIEDHGQKHNVQFKNSIISVVLPKLSFNPYFRLSEIKRLKKTGFCHVLFVCSSIIGENMNNISLNRIRKNPQSNSRNGSLIR